MHNETNPHQPKARQTMREHQKLICHTLNWWKPIPTHTNTPSTGSAATPRANPITSVPTPNAPKGITISALHKLPQLLYVHYMFTICSLYIHYKFTIYSPYILYSPYIHYIFTIYSLYVHYMFTICSLYVHYMFTIYSLPSQFTFLNCVRSAYFAVSTTLAKNISFLLPRGRL